MSEFEQNSFRLPPEQRAIRDKCFHPSGRFVEFPIDEIEQSIPDRFEKIVRLYPERLAVKMGDRALTYDELNQAANRIARRILHSQGAGEEPVVVLFEQGIEAIAAILGVLKSGKFYVPINPSFPNARIAAIVDDAQSSLLITDNKNIAVARKASKIQLNIDEINANFPNDNLGRPLSPDDLAYIIYTSGTTGKPKGVFQNQRNVLQWTLGHSNAIHICTADRLALMHSHSTSGGTHRMYDALLNGAALFPFDFRADGVKLAAWILDERITIYQSGPLVFRQWVDALNGPEPFPDLRLIRLSGMAMNAEDVARYRSHFSSDCLLVHVLGTSEAGTIPYYFIGKSSELSESTVPVGYSLGNSKVLVVDESGRRAEAGVVGEITIQSRYLACGYWRNVELTDEKFLPDAEGGPERLYLTGDLGRMSADGCLYHLGRKDLRVKIRGYSVEISEIEGALREHPAIKEVVVKSGADAKGEPQLIAYIVPASATELTASVLRKFLSNKLPEYMVPSIFITLPAMPLTANGKIDRKALPAPPNARPELEAVYVAPRTPLENELRKIWSEVLCLDDIGVNDNFFDLGGHSLMTAQVLARIRQFSQVDIPLQNFFAAPTLAALADYIENSRRTSVRAETFSLERISRDNPIPLSFAQQRLWFLDQLEPASVRYNVALPLIFTGPLDVDILKQCLNEIVRRHESLRTVITVVEGRPWQTIVPAITLELPVVDFSQSISEAALDSAMQQFITGEAQRPFDLSSGPLLRSNLLSLAPNRHILLLTLHHIVFDGWSGAIVRREFASLYADFVHGKSASLADLPIQYSDYAAWQLRMLQGAFLEDLLAYWKKQLANVSTLRLPTDRPRPTAPSCRGARKFFSLNATTTQALNALRRQENVTLFMLLLAAFQTLLHRYSGQPDIVTGTPVAGRAHAEIESLIGFFLNMLVLRADLSGNPTFRELLARTRQTCLDAYTHQEIPFEMLVEELQPERTINQNPLFQVSFVLQNFSKAPFVSSDITAVEIDIDPGIARFDLHVFMTEEEQGLKGYFEYNTDLFDAATIERMLGHFQTLLEGIVIDPEQRISDLPLLSEKEKHQLLIEWNDTQTEYPKDKCLHQLFEAQAEKTPDAVAVVFEEQQLTYRELNARANQLAHHLQKLGAGPEVLVGICLERSIEMIIGLLAILKAGGAYLPLDPSYPQERLEFMLNDARVHVLLTQEKFISIVDHHRTLCLDRDAHKIATQSTNNPQSNVIADNIAYVIYTSGSTGKPKGTQISHHNVARLFQATQTWFHFDTNDVWTLFHSYAFDFSVWEICGALLYGGKLVIVPHATSRSPEDFAKLLIQQRVTVLNQTPSAFRQLMPQFIGTQARQPLALRFVIFGGEALELQSLKPWIERYGDDHPQLINMYGITETTVHATYRRIKRADIESGSGSLIGNPIADLKIYLLDKNKALVPIGVAGEIFVGGAGLARGYLGQDALTAEHFIADPFSQNPRSKLYRSGDLARWTRDGDLEYLGRIDDQVKIRGFRIELGEIEAVLAQHPAIQQAVVLAREDADGGDKRLVAYVVTEASRPSTKELRDFLKQKLPDYMVPAAFVILGAMPLSANGKLDRKALPAPGPSRDLEHGFVAPRTPTEDILANIWAEVLKLDAVGVHDNFFELGGHSLLATRVVSRIRNALNCDLPLRTLFETPTLAGLAQSIQPGNEPPSVQSWVPALRRNDVPLSSAQQRLWFLDRLDPDRATYNVPAGIRLRGELNITALEQSLNEVIRRHEGLRTVFPTIHDHPAQKILPSLVLSLTPIDLGEYRETEREAALQTLLQQEAEQPFDLASGPLIRAWLWHLSAHDHVLFLNLHHIVSDGWSMGLLFRELSVLYRAYRSGEPNPLAELPIQYADYAIWQRNRLQGENLGKQVSYWKTKLDGIATLQLPIDHPRPAMQTHRGSSQTAELSVQLSKAIRAIGRREGATLFMTLLAAFQALLSRYTGQEDIAVGSPIAGRTCQETEGLIGFFVNTLVLRADLSGNPTFKELLRQVRETNLEAYTHQDLPFEKLVEELQPERNTSISPLFQVMFILQNAGDFSLELAGISAVAIRPATRTAKFDLMLTITEREGALDATLNYNVDLFQAATIERMLGHFQTLLEGIVHDPDQRISEMPLLTQAEKHQLLEEWNDTDREYPKEKCIHQLFEAQAEKTPDAIAVVLEEQQLTYQQLNKHANKLAHYLRQQGIEPGDRVGICLDLSVDRVVGLLGILKAGGAYLPLDPNYPAERWQFMLADAQAAVLLTQRTLLEDGGARIEAHDQSSPTSHAPTRVIYLDEDWRSIATHSEANLDSATRSDRPAYVIYTSGSTGQPKGVVMEHRALANLIAWQIEDFSRSAPARTLQFASLSFDVSFQEMFSTWCSGGTLVLLPAEVRRDPAALLNFLRMKRVERLFVPFVVLQQMAEAAHMENVVLPQLREVITAGERLQITPRIRSFLEKLPECHLVNQYGPTESHVVTAFSVDGPPECWGELPPIGRPIANTQIYILDAHLNPVPIGVVGEIYIGGDGLARGYFNRPELTAERFIYHSFDGELAQRLYKTGDLARYLPDGNIEFIGRTDNQVKIRGYRIELGEIEVVLAQHPGIREAVVITTENPTEEKQLVAYIVTGACAPEINELRAYLKTKLPD